MTKEEYQSLKVGDVIRSKRSGILRVVRNISRFRTSYGNCHKAGEIRGITCTIRRCSWTGRGDTYMTNSDVIPNYDKVPLRVRLESDFDKEFVRKLGCAREDAITCCDVKGIS